MVLLIDDDPDSRKLAARLSARGCEAIVVEERSEVARCLNESSLDAVIVNPTLFPEYSCQELVKHIRRRTSVRTAIVFLTPAGSLESCRSCPLLPMGRIDCIDKPAHNVEVITRLFWLLKKPHRKPAQVTASKLLSSREKEVLLLLRRCLSNREIAARLFVVEKVIEKHIASICRKLRVHNRTAVVAFSYRRRVF